MPLRCDFPLLLAATTTNALSPAGLPDYFNRALVIGTLTTIVIAGASLAVRSRLIAWKQDRRGFHYLTEGAEWVLAVAISVWGAFFELYKSQTWKQPSASLPGVFSGWLTLLTLYVVAKAIGVGAKRGDEEKMKALQARLDEKDTAIAKDRAQIELLTTQRNLGYSALRRFERLLIRRWTA
jgi:hypothetical protein